MFGIQVAPKFIATVVLAALDPQGEKLEFKIDFQFERKDLDAINALAVERDEKLALAQLNKEDTVQLNVDWLQKFITGWRDRNGDKKEIKPIDPAQLKELVSTFSGSPMVIYQKYLSASSGAALPN